MAALLWLWRELSTGDINTYIKSVQSWLSVSSSTAVPQNVPFWDILRWQTFWYENHFLLSYLWSTESLSIKFLLSINWFCMWYIFKAGAHSAFILIVASRCKCPLHVSLRHFKVPLAASLFRHLKHPGAIFLHLGALAQCASQLPERRWTPTHPPSRLLAQINASPFWDRALSVSRTKKPYIRFFCLQAHCLVSCYNNV